MKSESVCVCVIYLTRGAMEEGAAVFLVCVECVFSSQLLPATRRNEKGLAGDRVIVCRLACPVHL
jgi:hypothetical protein